MGTRSLHASVEVETRCYSIPRLSWNTKLVGPAFWWSNLCVSFLNSAFEFETPFLYLAWSHVRIGAWPLCHCEIRVHGFYFHWFLDSLQQSVETTYKSTITLSRKTHLQCMDRRLSMKINSSSWNWFITICECVTRVSFSLYRSFSSPLLD